MKITEQMSSLQSKIDKVLIENSDIISIPGLSWFSSGNEWRYVKTINGLIVRENVVDGILFGKSGMANFVLTYSNNKLASGIYSWFHPITNDLIDANSWLGTDYSHSLFKLNSSGKLITWNLRSQERFTETTVESGLPGLFTHVKYEIISDKLYVEKRKIEGNRFTKNASIVTRKDGKAYYVWKPILAISLNNENLLKQR
jgi:hypothetical protein